MKEFHHYIIKGHSFYCCSKCELKARSKKSIKKSILFFIRVKKREPFPDRACDAFPFPVSLIDQSPDRTFDNFWASKSDDRRFWSSHDSLINLKRFGRVQDKNLKKYHRVDVSELHRKFFDRQFLRNSRSGSLSGNELTSSCITGCQSISHPKKNIGSCNLRVSAFQSVPNAVQIISFLTQPDQIFRDKSRKKSNGTFLRF